MITNIPEHLLNIKILSDYKKSGLGSIEIFWDAIDRGKLINKNKTETTQWDNEPSEQELRRAKQAKEFRANIDFAEMYEEAIRGRILTKLKYDFPETPQAIDIKKLYSDFIEPSYHLKKYLDTSQKEVNYYTEIIKYDEPQNFFKKLSESQKENATPKESPNNTTTANQESYKNNFSVLEWATIFYYANTKNLLPIAPTIKATWETFMEDNKINTSSNNFKNNYYKAQRRINEFQNYPIHKLEKITPFISENYKQALTSLISDKNLLEDEQAE